MIQTVTNIRDARERETKDFNSILCYMSEIKVINSCSIVTLWKIFGQTRELQIHPWSEPWFYCAENKMRTVETLHRCFLASPSHKLISKHSKLSFLTILVSKHILKYPYDPKTRSFKWFDKPFSDIMSLTFAILLCGLAISNLCIFLCKELFITIHMPVS